jgi:hypothetical protein
MHWLRELQLPLRLCRPPRLFPYLVPFSRALALHHNRTAGARHDLVDRAHQVALHVRNSGSSLVRLGVLEAVPLARWEAPTVFDQWPAQHSSSVGCSDPTAKSTQEEVALLVAGSRTLVAGKAGAGQAGYRSREIGIEHPWSGRGQGLEQERSVSNKRSRLSFAQRTCMRIGLLVLFLVIVIGKHFSQLGLDLLKE